MTDYDDVTVEDIDLPTKRTTGETLQDRLTSNAYHNIIPSRYLKKNENGEPTESPEDLFERVGKNIALAEVVYEAENRDTEVIVTPDQLKPDHPRRDELAEEVFGEGVTADDDAEVELTARNVNKFAYDTIVPELEDDDLRAHVEDVAGEFQDLMERLGFIPNSPTLMNAGDELQQLSACFVDSPEDDIDDIHQTAKEAASVFQSGGGMGYAFWRLRPYGDTVGSTGGIASGPITFMETFDQMCETIAQGGARRGAQMGVMRVSHPDIVEFIHAKNKDVSLAHTLRLNDPDDHTYTDFSEALEEAQDLIDEDGRVPEFLRNAVEGHLSNFNISVGVTDDFMDAYKNGEDFTLTNPRTGEAHIATEETKEMYSRYDLGEYVTVGEELSIPAEVLFERIVEGAHENGEPGVVYIDRINQEHSFPVESTPKGDSSEYEILATNPCGEQPLMEYEACNLGHINLSTLADHDREDWRVWYDQHEDEYATLQDAVDAYMQEAVDVEEFNSRIETGTRFLENVVTMSDFPVDKISETVRNNRKIGLGIMGLAQLYIQLGMPYGSEEANAAAEWIMTHINHGSKTTSHELAEERGSFNNWEDSKYANPTEYPEWFQRQTGEDPEDWADEGYPMRNHNTTTIAPTGTTSMVGNTTGGCEPIYNVVYYKNVSDDVQGDEMLVEWDDYFMRVLEHNGIDTDDVKEEAIEQMENNEFDGISGLDTVPDAVDELFVVTGDLSAEKHASVQAACQKGVDSAISKTVNAPNDSTVADAKTVFEYLYDNGGKGVTYYRDGTRTKQVLTTRSENSEFSDMDEEDAAETIMEQIDEIFGGLESFLTSDEVRLEAEEEIEAVASRILGVDSTGQVKYASKKPRPDSLNGVTQRINTGYGKVYITINEDAETGEPFELLANIGKSGGTMNSFAEALGKVISVALRSGVDPDEIRGELEGTQADEVAWDRQEQIASLPDAFGTALRRYMNDEVDRPHTHRQASLDEAEEHADAKAESPDPATDGGTATASQASSSGGADVQAQQESAASSMGDKLCPDCGNMSVVVKEGCKECLREDCTYSKC